MDLNNGNIDIDDVTNHLAPKFGATFTALLATLEIQEMKQRAKLAKQESRASSFPASSGTNLKRSAESQDVSVPSKRARAESDRPSPSAEPRTPDQPTHPSDPNWTGSSSASKDEENTRALLKQLVMNTLSTLESDFRRIVWQQSGHRVELAQTYSTSLMYADDSETDSTKFLLGMESVAAINDGGLGIRYFTGKGPVQFQPGGIRSVLSLEVTVSRRPRLIFRLNG